MSLDLTKPYMGRIEDWWKRELGLDYGLGFIICGTCINHPYFGTDRGFHTSWVEKMEGNEIETRNSRYTLGEPRDD